MMCYAQFQFKHCTIIRPLLRSLERMYRISIQALYDYKTSSSRADKEVVNLFQFKHCTIIRSLKSGFLVTRKGISIQALYDYKPQMTTITD